MMTMVSFIAWFENNMSVCRKGYAPGTLVRFLYGEVCGKAGIVISSEGRGDAGWVSMVLVNGSLMTAWSDWLFSLKE